MKSKQNGPPEEASRQGESGKKTIKVDVSPAIYARLEAYAIGIAGGKQGNIVAIVRDWIMEKLPEAEKSLFPSTRPATPRGA